MRVCYFDTETRSPTKLSAGLYRYSESVEVIVLTYAIDDGLVVVVDLAAGEPIPAEFYEADVYVAHNAQFDIVNLAAVGIHLDPAKVRCTMVQALAHALPAGLADVCTALNVPADAMKDPRGKALIRIFCQPKRDGVWNDASTHPADWQAFKEYAAHDVVALRAVVRRTPRWNYPTLPAELALWQLDQRINGRGFAVDMALVDGAIAATEQRRLELEDEISAATCGVVDSARQRDAMLEFILNAHGVTLPDLQAATIERRLDDPDLPDPVKDLLRARLEASTASVAKYHALKNSTSSDGRLRGTLQFCGASRTGRWSGRIFQPQNLPRPSRKGATVEGVIAAIKAGCADLVELDVMSAASDCIRGAIIPGPGRRLYVADLNAIEGRVVAWLADEKWKLEAYAAYDRGEGPGIYETTAARILRKSPGDVTDAERTSRGKVPELALGYGGAVGAFSKMSSAYGVEMSEDEALVIVKAWRATNPHIVDLWYAIDRVVRASLVPENDGFEFPVGRLVVVRKGKWLRIVLPSGRSLCYPSPALDEGDRLTYSGIDQYSRKWGRIRSYGAKFVENATQAVARDVLGVGMLRAEAAGFEIVLTVHDEIIAEAAPSARLEDLTLAMSAPIDWAPGLPLLAKGFVCDRYRK